MILATLLKGLDLSLRRNDLLLPIAGVACNSKQVKPGDLFIAVRGPTTDGASYIPEAIQRGARGVIAERDFPSDPAVVKIIVKDSYQILTTVSHRFYGTPSEKLRVIGITGTNGKTTVSYLIESLLRQAGFGVGVIGTISHRVGERVIPAQNTTPGVLELQSLLAQMVQSGSDYAVMEVSSHALDQKRVEGIRFATALFTNLTQDHLDYHKTQEAYFEAKRKLFEPLDGEATAILNADSPYAERIASCTRSKRITYGLRNRADIFATSLEAASEGISLDAVTPLGKIAISSPLIGTHNAYNILAAIGAGIAQGVPLATLQQGIEKLRGVPGRLERVEAGQPFNVYVDFAHTEDALKEVLLSLRPFTAGRIILVFGCGGNRDRLKRPRMAETAGKLSDRVIVTSDNPRNENPQVILKEIAAGFPPFKNYSLEEDRAKAIGAALLSAEKGDTVLIAGKGHEAYQIFKDRTTPFDDRKVCYEILSRSRNFISHERALSSRRR